MGRPYIFPQSNWVCSGVAEKYKKFEIDEETIIKNQNIFYNLVYSGSLFDEKKFVIVNRATDKLFGLIDDISKKNTNDALIFIIAEKLEKKSKVRNLFEKSKKQRKKHRKKNFTLYCTMAPITAQR